MKSINHMANTVAACRILSSWNPDVKISPEVAEFLGQASASEDDIDFASGFQRIFNWHFYNNGNRIPDNSLVPGLRTSERRLERLLDKLERVLAHYAVNPARPILRNLLDTAGRVMHHIQDMSSPSHVVPIYHGPGRGDRYEDFAEKHVHCFEPVFNDEQKASDRQLLPFSGPEIEAAAGVSGDPHAGFRALYHRSARETLDYIRRETIELTGNHGKRCCPLSDFWREGDEGQSEPGKKTRARFFLAGFGTYGILGNTFGSETLRIDNRTYSVDREKYLEIHKSLVKRSILDSISALAYLFRRAGSFPDMPV